MLVRYKPIQSQEAKKKKASARREKTLLALALFIYRLTEGQL